MKRLMTVCAALGMALAAAAQEGLTDAVLSFSTKGPDKYADGTTVLDGEVYALVWTASGAEFGGLAADGTPVLATDKVVLLAPLATGGRCPNVNFQLSAATAEALQGGTYGVYLLDTRVQEGDATRVVGAPNRKLEVLNGYVAVTDAAIVTGSGKTTLSETAVENGQQVAVGAAVPRDAAPVKIVGIDASGDQFIKLTLEATEGRVQAHGGEAVTDDGAQGVTQVPQDNVIYVPKTGASGFFKVIRN